MSVHGGASDNTTLGWILLIASYIPLGTANDVVTFVLHLLQIVGIVSAVYYTRKAAQKKAK